MSDALTYFLTIDGIDGGSTVDGHVGAFEISAYDFNVTLASSLGGGGAGKAEFSPLTVDLALKLGLTSLLSAAAGGTHIDAVRLEGVRASDNQTVYDLKLANVTVAVYQDVSGGQDQLVFDYAQFGLSTKSQNANGSLNAAQSFAFDVVNNVAIDPSTLPTASPGSTLGVIPEPDRYFLTIDGIDGGSTVDGHVGAFEISAYDFNVTLASSLGGGGAGKAEFSPLTVDLALKLGLTSLLSAAAGGTHIDAVRLEGVRAPDNQTVYDLKLANVTVAVYQDVSGGQDQLVFDYAQFGLSTKSQNANGSLNAAQSFAFDVVNHVAIDPSTLPTASPGSSLGVIPEPNRYFLTIDGIDGGSTVDGHVGAFEISAYDFNVTLASSLGGGGAGKAEFSPLTVDLALKLGLTSLLSAAVRGTHIDAVRLEGGRATDNQPVDDLKLAKMTVPSYLS